MLNLPWFFFRFHTSADLFISDHCVVLLYGTFMRCVYNIMHEHNLYIFQMGNRYDILNKEQILFSPNTLSTWPFIINNYNNNNAAAGV